MWKRNWGYGFGIVVKDGLVVIEVFVFCVLIGIVDNFIWKYDEV